MDELDEIVQEFLVESHENLDQLDRDLVELERDPASVELLGSIFRTIHTIKGTSGFLAFARLEALTHVGENLLSRLRDGVLHLDPATASALLQMVDAVRGLLAVIEATGEEGDADHSDLVALLTELLDPAPAEPPGPPAEAAGATEPPEAADAPPPLLPPEAGTRLGNVLVDTGVLDDRALAAAVVEQGTQPDPPRIGELLVASGEATPAQVAEALEVQETKRSLADSSIRVDVDLLDSLMRQVGELVLTRNQIVATATSMQDVALLRAAQRLNLIASELQEGVMKTRMQPIDNVWSRLPRVVRDLGVACGRDVRVEMEGRDTELDRTILEAVKDPITHLVRNAVDHGIEDPAARTAAGKPAQGRLQLRAFHEGGRVNIEIRDDGAGIDAARIAAKAVDRGLVTADQAARMSGRELLDLIFLPGFSTAAAVTNVSGRGVGMDVVRTNVEKIGGSVDVSTELGQGTTFRIKIPLTLAIIPALTVECAGDRYAIPQVSLVELVCLEGEQARTGIETISGAPVHRLRGKLLPLVHLAAELGVGGPDDAGTGPDAVYIAVLQAEGRQFGLVVDKVLNTEEIVVKPLGSQLKGMGVYAGATILGDGAVSLILDVMALAQRSRVLSETREQQALAQRLAAEAAAAEDLESLLVVGLGADRRMAIPLAMVTRLEEFPTSSVEHVGSREVVQYRQEILPLVRLARHLGAFGAEDSERLQVVVYSERDRSVGLVVDCILDIVRQGMAARSHLDDHGLTGSAVIQDKITELLDVRQAILAADPHFYALPALDAAGEASLR